MLSDAPSTESVYADLYARHAGLVLTYLSDKIRDHGTAEDVAQDAWLRAHRFLPTVLERGDTVGKSWVLRIATNAMYDHFRRVKARPQTSDIDDALSPGSAFPEALLDGETPEAVALLEAEHDDQQAAAALLMELVGFEHGRLLWLREWRGLSLKEIAQKLSGNVPVPRTKEQRRRGEWPSPRSRQVVVTVPAVKSRLFQAREAQREWWAYNEAHRHEGKDVASRLWSYLSGVRRDDRQSCWVWQGSIGPNDRPRPRFCVTVRPGGPMVVLNGRRVAYALARGPLPPWALLSPTCGHPGCVSPWHAVVVTRSYRPLDPAVDAPAPPRWRAADDDGCVTEGERFHRRRLELGLSVKQLGREANVNGSTISVFEKGQWVLPSTRTQILDTLARLGAELSTVPDGTSVRARRIALGLSIRQISRLIPVQEHTLADMEKGKRPTIPSVLRRITDALDRLERQRQEAAA